MQPAQISYARQLTNEIERIFASGTVGMNLDFCLDHNRLSITCLKRGEYEVVLNPYGRSPISKILRCTHIEKEEFVLSTIRQCVVADKSFNAKLEAEKYALVVEKFGRDIGSIINEYDYPIFYFNGNVEKIF